MNESSGDLDLKTPNAVESGVSGSVLLSTGRTASGSSGNFEVSTGTAADGSSGQVDINVGPGSSGDGGSFTCLQVIDQQLIVLADPSNWYLEIHLLVVVEP